MNEQQAQDMTTPEAREAHYKSCWGVAAEAGNKARALLSEIAAIGTVTPHLRMKILKLTGEFPSLPTQNAHPGMTRPAMNEEPIYTIVTKGCVKTGDRVIPPWSRDWQEVQDADIKNGVLNYTAVLRPAKPAGAAGAAVDAMTPAIYKASPEKMRALCNKVAESLGAQTAPPAKQPEPDIQTMRLAVARMLPNEIKIESGYTYDPKSDVATSCEWGAWLDTGRQINDREWLHVCWLAEQTLDDGNYPDFMRWIASLAVGNTCSGARDSDLTSAPVNHRLEALCRVKNPEMFKP